MLSLRALAPYQPVTIALAMAAFGYGFYWDYWRGAPGNPSVTIMLWLALVLVGAVISFPYWFGFLKPCLP